METNNVIEKIKKLLALSNSCNEHEAALAASHAQRLLAEYNLAMADINTAQKPEKADKIETTVAKTLPKWVRHLTAGVSSAFDCQVVHHPANGKLTFIGIGADVRIAAYTFTYLDRSVRKLCNNYMKQHATDTIADRHRELMRQSYYLGAISTINRMLATQKKETPVTQGAMVPIKEGLIKKAMDEIGNIRTMRSRRSYVNSGAYAQGQTDGKQVGIRKAVDQSAQETGNQVLFGTVRL